MIVFIKFKKMYSTFHFLSCVSMGVGGTGCAIEYRLSPSETKSLEVTQIGIHRNLSKEVVLGISCVFHKKNKKRLKCINNP